MRPSSASASTKAACSSQPDCSSSARDGSHAGPERWRTTRNMATSVVLPGGRLERPARARHARRMADAQQAPGALGDVPPMPLGTYQFEIYGRGLGGETPLVPLEYDELEARARAELPPEAWAYAAGGAGEGRTIAAHPAAFDRWSLVPRMLTDVTVRHWGTEVLGTRLNAPVLLGPVGVLSIVHPDAELAVARAAAATGAGMVLSTAASTSLEDVAAAAGDAP